MDQEQEPDVSLKLARVRILIKQADPDVVEDWKWRGVPVWSHAGMVCTGETYKNLHEGDKFDEKALNASPNRTVGAAKVVGVASGRR